MHSSLRRLQWWMTWMVKRGWISCLESCFATHIVGVTITFFLSRRCWSTDCDDNFCVGSSTQAVWLMTHCGILKHLFVQLKTLSILLGYQGAYWGRHCMAISFYRLSGVRMKSDERGSYLRLSLQSCFAHCCLVLFLWASCGLVQSE